MRETAFIQQNQEKWREFEQILEGDRHDADKLNDLFIQVTDDLSYARTFYPNRSVRVYLNGLAQRIFANIYKGKTSRRSRFVAFWKDDLPLLMYEARKDLLTSFLVFALAIGIGMLSCAADPDFLQVILGQDYVEMTKENIKSGDPMAVYKQKGEFNAFLGITLNNVRVAFFTFIFGVFYAIGTIGILLYNGVMLGAFQFFFIQEGLFRESFLAVWMHGSFEISSIVIAGAAGLTMGKGLVFPGTLARMRSFQLAARRGVSILMGTLPLFVIAGFVESFLTRYTDAPDALRAAFIIFCLGFTLFYFVIYPAWKVKKIAAFSRFDETRLTPDADRSIHFSTVKTVGDVFTDAFIFCRLHFKTIGWAAAEGALIYCLGAFLLADVPARQLFFFEEGFMGMGIYESLPQLFANENNRWLFLLTPLALAPVIFVGQSRLAAAATDSDELLTELAPGSRFSTTLDFLKVLGVAVLLSLVVLTLDWYTVLLVWLTFPFMLTWTQVMLTEGSNPFAALGRTFQLSGKSLGEMVGLFVTLLLCGMLFLLLPNTGVVRFLLSFIGTSFNLSPGGSANFSTILLTFICMFALLLVFSLWAVGFGLLYFSNLEIKSASALRERIKSIAKQQKIKGLAREG